MLVTGANGQLGNEIRAIAHEYKNDFNFIFHNRASLDISSAKSLDDAFEESKAKYLINCAAYTAVDKAEDDIESCFKINRDAMTSLGISAQKHSARVIHVSTDYVFDGQAKNPYKTTDATNPQSVYGQSKLEGEQNLSKHCSLSIIIRTSWLYSSFGNNFVKTMIRLGNERDSLSVVADQKGCPTYAADLAEAILNIIKYSEDKKEFKSGIYHYSNLEETTWFDFCKEIHRLAKVNCQVTPITTAEYPTRAKRPAYSVMDTSKLQETFKINIANWKNSLSVCINKLNQ